MFNYETIKELNLITPFYPERRYTVTEKLHIRFISRGIEFSMNGREFDAILAKIRCRKIPPVMVLEVYLEN